MLAHAPLCTSVFYLPPLCPPAGCRHLLCVWPRMHVSGPAPHMPCSTAPLLLLPVWRCDDKTGFRTRVSEGLFNPLMKHSLGCLSATAVSAHHHKHTASCMQRCRIVVPAHRHILATRLFNNCASFGGPPSRHPAAAAASPRRAPMLPKAVCRAKPRLCRRRVERWTPL